MESMMQQEQRPQEQSSQAQHSSDQDSLSSIFKNLFFSLNGLMRSEVKLAKLEMKQQTLFIVQQVSRAILAGAVAWLALQCLIVFAIVSLGSWLDGRYWLSALIVGLVLGVPSILYALRTFRHIQEEARLQTTLSNVQADRELVSRTFSEITKDIRNTFKPEKVA
jgi:uncharacterized membrane protein YqjE